MRRVFGFIWLIALLVSALGFDVEAASARSLITYEDGIYVSGKGIVFIFDASGYRNRDVHGTTMFVGSSFYDLGCTVNKEEGRIICVARGGLSEFAGQTGIIHLAGQIFYVIIPDRYTPDAPEEPLVCDPLETTGAYVYFTYGEGLPETIFIPGASLEEVAQTAQNWMNASEGYILSFEIVSDLTCGEIPQ